MDTLINDIIWNEPASTAMGFENRVAEIEQRYGISKNVASVVIAMIDGQKTHNPSRILSGFKAAQDAFDAYGVLDYTENDVEQLDEIISGCAHADAVIECEFLRQLNEHLDDAGVGRATEDTYGDPIRWDSEINRAEVTRLASLVAWTFIDIARESALGAESEEETDDA